MPDTAPPNSLSRRDARAVLHPYTDGIANEKDGPLVIVRGEGVRVFDEDGRDYIEGMSGLWCTSLGWGEEALVEAAAGQMRKLAFGHLFAGRSHEPAIALAEKLKEVADEVDSIHDIKRAMRVGSVDHIISPSDVRPFIIGVLERRVAGERLAEGEAEPVL